jgi:flagellar biosynthesis/type III secretory pathway chaperone
MNQSQSLSSALEAEIAGLERLLLVLRDEQSILISAHIDRLSDLLPLKTQLLTELEAATGVRRSEFSAAGIPDHATDIANWIRSQDAGLFAQWEKLLSLAQQAAHFNRSNGQLIQNREEAQRIFLNSLTKTENTAYTASGRVINSNSRRPLDQA